MVAVILSTLAIIFYRPSLEKGGGGSGGGERISYSMSQLTCGERQKSLNLYHQHTNVLLRKSCRVT